MKRLSAILLAVCAMPVFAGEPPAQAATCVACHGESGAKPILPSYPVLAGQYANYLEHSLIEYKEGKRKNAVMAAQAAALSKEDIKLLSRYFAKQASPLYTPSVHGELHQK